MEKHDNSTAEMLRNPLQLRKSKCKNWTRNEIRDAVCCKVSSIVNANAESE